MHLNALAVGMNHHCFETTFQAFPRSQTFVLNEVWVCEYKTKLGCLFKNSAKHFLEKTLAYNRKYLEHSVLDHIKHDHSFRQ